VGKFIEVLQGNDPGFHATHRETGHAAMGLI
jgi:hypothetical protein